MSSLDRCVDLITIFFRDMILVIIGFVAASYGYAAGDILFKWRDPNPIGMGDLQMAQFKLERYELGVINDITKRKMEFGFRNDSVAYLNFYLERQTGFFLMQVG